MNVGMLWLDDERDRSLQEKVRRAAEYYQRKYGDMPQLCFVNQTAVAEGERVDQIDVVPAAYVLPHHFWLGMRES
ncbi:MAG: hypothetical protein R3300_09910 [Candidatus Promineifilaceae bacterium]|nr:hypothetical protein [Candidatus Promineifilaceae bacterium]